MVLHVLLWLRLWLRLVLVCPRGFGEFQLHLEGLLVGVAHEQTELITGDKARHHLGLAAHVVLQRA